jgi:hypothetical protein
LVIIHQTRIASGAGVWELNKIVSTGAGTNWTLAYPLMNTYAALSQVYRLVQYKNITIDSGKTLTATAWGGTTGGIVALIANGTITVTGIIVATGKGFVAQGNTGVNQIGFQGEGTVGAGGTRSISANGNGGGGGGNEGSDGGGGAGGGHAAAGTAGQASGGSSGGTSGAAAGAAALTTMVFGGAGGSGGGNDSGNAGGVSGAGGGIVLLIAPTITVTGTIITGATNGNGGSGTEGAGGGGAGGSVLLKGKTLTLGTNLITAPAGAGKVCTGGDGGAGSVGRIHADYSLAISGQVFSTELPNAAYTTLDTTITDGGPRFINFL